MVRSEDMAKLFRYSPEFKEIEEELRLMRKEYSRVCENVKDVDEWKAAKGAIRFIDILLSSRDNDKSLQSRIVTRLKDQETKTI